MMEANIASLGSSEVHSKSNPMKNPIKAMSFAQEGDSVLLEGNPNSIIEYLMLEDSVGEFSRFSNGILLKTSYLQECGSKLEW